MGKQLVVASLLLWLAFGGFASTLCCLTMICTDIKGDLLNLVTFKKHQDSFSITSHSCCEKVTASKKDPKLKADRCGCIHKSESKYLSQASSQTPKPETSLETRQIAMVGLFDTFSLAPFQKILHHHPPNLGQIYLRISQFLI